MAVLALVCSLWTLAALLHQAVCAPTAASTHALTLMMAMKGGEEEVEGVQVEGERDARSVEGEWERGTADEEERRLEEGMSRVHKVRGSAGTRSKTAKRQAEAKKAAEEDPFVMHHEVGLWLICCIALSWVGAGPLGG